MCLVVLLAAFAPRLALLLVWIFTNLVDRAFSGFLLPFLGLILAPYTTLFYVLAWSPAGGVSYWGWMFVSIGVLFDISHWTGGGLAGRRRFT